MTNDDEVPGAARLVRDFVNTYERQVDHESLGTVDALGDWLVEHHLAPVGAVVDQPSDLAIAVAVREGVRTVLLGHGGHPADDLAATDALRAALTDVPVRVELDLDGYRLVAVRTDPVGRALGQLLDAVRQSTGDGTWPRLKVCARDTCRWAYYDASRNQVRRWCSMAGCGNYVKMRRASSVRKARAQVAAAR